MSPLSHGTNCYVPRELAICPECGGEIEIVWPVGNQWSARCKYGPAMCGKTGDKWQPVVDAIREWSGAK